jgi:tRNA (cmo5U34)-methyltransferase
LLSSALEGGDDARLLVVGAGGTAQEILVAGRLEVGWHFTAVDPSPPMLAGAQSAVEAAELSSRTKWHLGFVEGLADSKPFDAATLIGLLHHLQGDESKLSLLRAISSRLKPNAPLILGCNRGAYVDRPLFLKAWARRWRLAGAPDEEIQTKIGKILQGVDPPVPDEGVAKLLELAGFKAGELFFSSLFWGAWIARNNAKAGSASGNVDRTDPEST